MRLASVYEHHDAVAVLFRLLEERDPVANISHKQMPTWEEHGAFVARKPYAHWFLIEDFGLPKGAIYLTFNDEIGIQIFKEFQGQGWGTKALKHLQILAPRKRYFANVSPANLKSQQFFLKHGFKPRQVTYELSL